jgi:hypothetical protein
MYLHDDDLIKSKQVAEVTYIKSDNVADKSIKTQQEVAPSRCPYILNHIIGYMKSSIVLNITLCRALKALLAVCFMLVPCLAYSSILKMEAIGSEEKSVAFRRTTRRYIP